MSLIGLNQAKQQIGKFIEKSLPETQTYRILTNTGNMFKFQVVLSRNDYEKLMRFMYAFQNLAERYFVVPHPEFEQVETNPGEGKLWRYIITLRMWSYTIDGDGATDE